MDLQLELRLDRRTDEMNLEARIPAEILSEIFHLLCDEPIALEKLENSLCFDGFPWAVGQVCLRWRTTFLSHPPLWTSLSLHNPSGNRSAAHFAEMNRRSAIYLKRSGQLPLALTVSISSDTPILTTWKTLVSCSNRWRSADIELPTGTAIDNALLECRGRIPILESLKICQSGLERMGCYNVFEIAPHLTKLDLELYNGWTGTSIRFPWAQLTTLGLTLSYVSPGFAASDNELRAFLLQLQNVEELHFAIDFDSSHGDFKFPPVRLTRLRSLDLSVGLASFVFSWFELPLLERLWLDYQYLDEDGLAPESEACGKELLSLVDRSSCRIRQLILESCCDGRAHTIMKTLASVEEFYIVDLVQLSGIVRDIADSDGCIYLPKMRALHVKCCPGHFGMLVADLSHLLKVRSKESTVLSTLDTAPLESLTIRVDWGNCVEPCCVPNRSESRTQVDGALQAMSSWPSFSLTNVHRNQSNKRSVTLKVHALAAGTLIDLTLYYPNWDNRFIEEHRRCHSVLDNMRAIVI